jgi:hypothetical protein
MPLLVTFGEVALAAYAVSVAVIWVGSVIHRAWNEGRP